MVNQDVYKYRSYCNFAVTYIFLSDFLTGKIAMKCGARSRRRREEKRRVVLLKRNPMIKKRER